MNHAGLTVSAWGWPFSLEHRTIFQSNGCQLFTPNPSAINRKELRFEV